MPSARREPDPPPAGFLRLDPRRSNYVTALGRKGSGKSILLALYFRSFPGDRLVIDPTGDALPRNTLPPGIDPRAEVLRVYRGEPPDVWPTDAEGRRVTVRFVPDMARSSYVEDMDRAVGVAYAHEGTCCWIDELADVARVNRVHPFTRRALHQGRHRDLTLLMAGPRPIDVDPLVLSQADILATFEFPNPRDRERLADHMGLPRAQLDALMQTVRARGRHAFLALDRRTQPRETVGVMPPIGAGIVAALKRGELWTPTVEPTPPHPELPHEAPAVPAAPESGAL